MKKLTIMLTFMTLAAVFAFGQKKESLAAPEGMALVPAGTFMMGDTMYDWEKPVHEVRISKAYYMGKYEVTQAEWEEVMGSSPSAFKGDDLPVENVSWNDVIDYCNKRSAAEGLTPCYSVSDDTVSWDFSANGYRLPTEAEWEWAARGTGKGRLDYQYSGSDTAGDVAWYDENSGRKTHPVGQKQANSLGIYDMSGNVWEWCWDWYWDYPSSSQTDPRGAASGTGRVLRGGSWRNLAQIVRSAFRGDTAPGYRLDILGFRVVRSF